MRYLVVGAGISGLGAASLLTKLGEDVVLYDKNKEKLLSVAKSGLVDKKVELCIKNLCKAIKNSECIVLSPGISLDNKIQKLIQEKHITLISEIELGAMHCTADIVAITGTNGKTTTTLLTTHILNKTGHKAQAVGNVGVSLCSVVHSTCPNDLLICEVSSFQLLHTMHFCPHISVFLNFASDHLNVHKDINEYLQAKKKIFANQTSKDYAIFNYDDEVVRQVATECKANIIFISAKQELSGMQNCAWIEHNTMHIKLDGLSYEVALNNKTLARGPNTYNTLAACVIALLYDTNPHKIQNALLDYKLPAHRCEYFAKVDGVSFVDDSKATNIHATKNAIQSFDTPIVLMLGGSDKGESFDEFLHNLAHNVKMVVCFGKMGKKIFKLCQKYLIPSIYQKDLALAVKKAKENAILGDVVLFSPACASFDKFSSYQERGEFFKYLVNGENVAKN